MQFENKDWIAVAAILVSAFTAYKTFRLNNKVAELNKKEKIYTDIDSLYFQLLKIGMENPNYRDINWTAYYIEKIKVAPNDDKIKGYESYAFMVWNFCETIYDKNNGINDETWKPIWELESNMHAAWFRHSDNKKKFKETFRKFAIKQLNKIS